jgi:hypothetical protein
MGNIPSSPILAFVGDSAWMYIAVNRIWRAEYETYLRGSPKRTTLSGNSRLNITMLEWALVCGLPGEMACPAAAAAGQVDVLKHAITLGCPCDARLVLERAAVAGQLRVIRWGRKHLHFRGYHQLFLIAHAYNHIGLVAYFRKKGFSLDSSCGNDYICAIMARGGHLHVLQWLRATMAPKYPIDSTTCAYAAEGGHLHVLQWLRANGCEWDRRACVNAARRGHGQVLRWLIDNGCES